MADIVSREVRSRMMSGIRSKNTGPELIIRKGLHARGYRFRLHDRRLPGKPDLVLPKYNAVIFAHGCFWHGHNCHLFKLPKTRSDFWISKIQSNQNRDNEAYTRLARDGWRIAEVWECSLKGRTRLPMDVVIDRLDVWLVSDIGHLTLAGNASLKPMIFAMPS